MQVIPVIDLRGGIAVHAIAGERAKYQPVGHSEVSQGNVAALAAFYARRGPDAIYVADLDAIGGGDPRLDCWNTIAKACDCPLWIDMGVRDEGDLDAFVEFEAAASQPHRLVIASETLTVSDAIGRIVQRISPSRIVCSLDRKAGRPLGSWKAQGDEISILAAARAVGIRDVIALDLAAVGKGGAADFLDSWRLLMRDFPELRWRLGGGVKSRDDLAAVEDAGFCGVLSATAILQGAL